MSACCHSLSESKGPTLVHRVRETLAWVLPSALLLLVPKCPACLAAHVALWTGIGLSFATASYLRWALLFVCISLLLYLAAKRRRAPQHPGARQ